MQSTGLKEADNAAQLQFSFTSLPAVNNTVFVGCSVFANSANQEATTVVDNQANSYSKVEQTGSSLLAASIHKAGVVTSAGTFTFTVTLASGTGYFSCAAIEWSNSGASMSLDQTAGNSGAPGATSGNTGTTGATTSTNELVLAVIDLSANDPDDSVSTPASSGYTSIAREPNSQAHSALEFSYKTVAATGTQTASWTFDASAYAAVIGTFTLAAPSGSIDIFRSSVIEGHGGIIQ